MFKIKNIIKLINNSNKSRYQISQETGIHAATLSRIVHGEQKDIELRNAFKLADSLGVDINRFREEQDK